MAIDIESLNKDVGLAVRDAIRLDSFFINYAYLGDYRTITTGKITTGTDSLVVNNPEDISVGSKIGIMGAGTDGARLVSTVLTKVANVITISDDAITTVTDSDIVLFNSGTTAKGVNNWIFLGRPKQQGETVSPKINIDIIDGTPEEKVTFDGKVQTNTAFVIHFFLDKDKAQSYDDSDFIDKLKSIVRNLRRNNAYIKDSGVLSGYSNDEDENGKIWIHGLVRGFIQFREG